MEKLKIKEFRNGVFILDFMDEDLLLNPVEVKLVRYPGKVLLVDSIYKGIDSYIDDIPEMQKMSDDYVNYLLSDVELISLNSNELKDSDYYDVTWYYKYMNSNSLFKFAFLRNTYSALSVRLKGLELIIHINRSDASLHAKSSFQFLGHSNPMARWYMSLLDRYIDIKLKNGENRSV